MQTLLHGAQVYTGHGFEAADVLISDGLIAGIYPCNAAQSDSCGVAADTIIELHNKYIFPGFVDVHVHFREPGFLYKEDIATGSMAAAAGGYTDVCTMPNLKPVPDSLEHLNEELDAIQSKAVINVYPYASMSVGEIGEQISELEAMAPYVVGFSDDGRGLAGDAQMLEVMRRVKALNGIISAHCEDLSVIGGAHVHDGLAAQRLGIKGISSESEWAMVKRDIALAKETGCRYHVCHVSTKESVELIRKAKAEGVDVTCETGPHYLLLDENDIVKRLDDGCSAESLGRFKMNPPLRSADDREALKAGLLDGTIDMIATDHAPHSAEEKAKGLLGAPLGVVGLECAFPVMYTGYVRTGLLTLERLVELMSSVPARRFNIASGICVGAKANLCVYDLDEKYIVDPQQFKSKGHATPFDGAEVYGKCLMTICGGRVVYSSER